MSAAVPAPSEPLASLERGRPFADRHVGPSDAELLPARLGLCLTPDGDRTTLCAVIVAIATITAHRGR